MPIDINTIISKMSENTDNLLKKFPELQKETKEFSNDATNEDLEDNSTDEETTDDEEKLYKARLQLYNFNLNFRRINNFALQKENYDKEMKKLFISKTKLTEDLNNLSKNTNPRTVPNSGLKFFSEKLRREQKIEEEKIKKVKVAAIEELDELVTVIKSRINSHREFEDIFDTVPEEQKSKTKTQDDILREGIKKYQISNDILRKWKEELELDKRKYQSKYGVKDINYEGNLQKQEQKKALNIVFQNLDVKVDAYFDQLKTEAETAANKELQKLYVALDEKAGIKGFGKAWALLNQVTDEEKNQTTNETLLKNDFYNLAMKESAVFKQKILEIIGKKSELSKSDLALLQNETRIIREKVKTRLNLSSLNCEKGKILNQVDDLQKQREKTATKIDKKANRLIQLSGSLSTKQYEKEKVMTKNHLEAIKNAKIGDFIVAKNSNDTKILDMLYQSPIEHLEQHLCEKEVEIGIEENKNWIKNQLKTVEIKIFENQEKWKNFEKHELAEIEFYSESLNDQQLTHEDLVNRWVVLPDNLNLGKKRSLSSERPKNFNSWDTFKIPYSEIVDEELVRSAMEKSPECPQHNPEFNSEDDLSDNNPKFFPFPKNEDEWSDQESEAHGNVNRCKMQHFQKEKEKLLDEEKQLTKQIAEIKLKQHNAVNSIKELESAKQKRKAEEAEKQKRRAEEAEKQKQKAEETEKEKQQAEAAKSKAKEEAKRQKLNLQMAF